MPELPEVETIVRGLRLSVLAQKIKKTAVFYKNIVSGGSLEKLLIGDSFQQIDRHGKYIKIKTKKGNRLIIHLRMTGQLFIADKKYQPDKHVHLIIDFASGRRLIYRDIRKFGRWTIVAGQKDFQHYINAGRDALTISVNELADLMKKNKTKKIKAFLLDQTKIAGIGNIYADEICYELKVNPNTKVGKVQPRILHKAIIKILKLAIKHKGTSVSDYLTSEGARGKFQNKLKVYQQKNCSLCNSVIKRTKTAGRSTHYCPQCQK